MKRIFSRNPEYSPSYEMSPFPYYGRSEMQSEVNIFRKLIKPFPGEYERRESALSHVEQIADGTENEISIEGPFRF